MKKRIGIVLSIIFLFVYFSGCELSEKDPIRVFENFEDGSIDSGLGVYSPSEDYVPEIVTIGDNKALKLSSSTDSLSDLGLTDSDHPDSDHPLYSGAATGGGPNQRTLYSKYPYTLEYRMKIIDYDEDGSGYTSLSFRYYGPSFDDRVTFIINPGLDFRVGFPDDTDNQTFDGPLPFDTWINVSIVSRPDRFSISIDNEKIFEKEDTPDSMWNATWTVNNGFTLLVDDIKITRLDL